MQKLTKKNMWLIARTGAIVLVLIGLKYFLHSKGWEFITVNNLLSGIIGANVFLMGFLLSGVLSDFKEAEKIPGELATLIHSLNDEMEYVLQLAKAEPVGSEFKDALGKLAGEIRLWFHREIKTRDLLFAISGINGILLPLEGKVPANYLVRMRTDLAQIKRIVIRTDVIRDTSFISSGYLIATITTILMVSGLVLAKLDPFIESLFFVGVISFLMIFLLLLIHDLDNPFNYKARYSAENVSLYSLERIICELKERR